MIEKKTHKCSYWDDDVINCVNLLEKLSKICLKYVLKYVFFLCLKNFEDFFSAFESQDNIQIEYM